MENKQREKTPWIDRPILFEVVVSAIGGLLVACIGFLQHRFVIGLETVPIEFLVAPFFVGASLAAMVAYFIRQSRRHLVNRLITEQSISDSHKSAKEKLEVSLQAIIETVLDGIITIDEMGIILTFNPMATKLFGYEADEVVGQNINMLMPEPYHSEHDGYLANYKQTNVEQIIGNVREVVGLRKDGSTFPMDLGVSEMNIENERMFTGVVRDISLLKEHDKSLVAAKEHAEAANKAKSNLMANMSHELRTPLNAIIGFSSTIQAEMFGPLGNEKYREYLNDIHDSGRHLLELINDILDLTAFEEGALSLNEENVDIPKVVEAAVRIIQPRADHGKISVSSALEPGIPEIYADERRLRQVMLNLLSNAVKFTPESGKVIVDSLLNEDGSLSVFVSDTGYGMNDEEAAIALSKFGQVDSGHDRKHEGSGLGLPLTKGLMELHGGTLEIDSLEGYGTMVTATFPTGRVI